MHNKATFATAKPPDEFSFPSAAADLFPQDELENRNALALLFAEIFGEYCTHFFHTYKTNC